MQKNPLRVLVVGCGNMGSSHALAYRSVPGFKICGLVSTGESKVSLNIKLGGGIPLFADLETAINTTSPDCVCISTYHDTHEKFAIQSMESGCHVFIEKPLAATVEGAKRMIDAATRTKRKMVVGYILRHHPSWQ